MDDKIEVENVNHPGKTNRVNRAKYSDVRQALLKVLPSEPPGMTAAASIAALKPFLDQSLFPGGAKAGWWHKTVQLDLEAKGIIARTDAKRLHLYRVK